MINMAPTELEKRKMIGKTGLLEVKSSSNKTLQENLRVPVRVKDVRGNFGRTELLITPVGGEGEQWVSLERVDMES